MVRGFCAHTLPSGCVQSGCAGSTLRTSPKPVSPGVWTLSRPHSLEGQQEPKLGLGTKRISSKRSLCPSGGRSPAPGRTSSRLPVPQRPPKRPQRSQARQEPSEVPEGPSADFRWVLAIGLTRAPSPEGRLWSCSPWSTRVTPCICNLCGHDPRQGDEARFLVSWGGHIPETSNSEALLSPPSPCPPDYPDTSTKSSRHTSCPVQQHSHAQLPWGAQPRARGTSLPLGGRSCLRGRGQVRLCQGQDPPMGSLEMGLLQGWRDCRVVLRRISLGVGPHPQGTQRRGGLLWGHSRAGLHGAVHLPSVHLLVFPSASLLSPRPRATLAVSLGSPMTLAEGRKETAASSVSADRNPGLRPSKYLTSELDLGAVDIQCHYEAWLLAYYFFFVCFSLSE